METILTILLILLVIYPVSWVCTVLHEAGHAVIGYIFFGLPREFIVGRDNANTCIGNIKFGFGFNLNGAVLNNINVRLAPKWQELVMIASGPIFSFIGTVVPYLILSFSTLPIVINWILFTMVFVNGINTIMNSIPDFISNEDENLKTKNDASYIFFNFINKLKNKKNLAKKFKNLIFWFTVGFLILYIAQLILVIYLII